MAVKQWKLDKWLKRAVLEGDFDDARRALVAGGDCNQAVEVDTGSSTLLIQAACKHIALTQLLLEHGADVHGQDCLGATALHLAAQPEIVTALLNAGADPNAKTFEQDTPLHFCTAAEKARLLIDAGADRTLKNDVEQLPWECVELSLENIQRVIGLDPEIISSCHEAVDLLRSLAEHDELADATTPVLMTAEEETKKAQDGRF